MTPQAEDARREKGGELTREFDKVASKRGIFERHWEDVSRVVLPYYSTSFYSQGNTAPGTQRNQDLFDTTANTALFRFAAAMESMLTPRTSKWHRVRLTNPDLMKLRDVQLWCDQVNDLLFQYRYNANANYASQQHDAYISIGAFGTGSLFIDANRDAPGLRYRNVHLGELFFAENHQGVVDKVYRRFKMTLRQCVQRWGEDNLPSKVTDKVKDFPENEVQVLHVCRPRADHDPSRLDAKRMPFESFYVIKDESFLVEESGYYSFPYTPSRYITAPGELYGRSPAMNVLPNIKVLNEMKKTMLKQGQRAVDPVLLLHDDGILEGFNLTPGATNFGAVNGDGRQLVHTLPVGNMQIGKENMDDERMAINDAFLVTLFQILIDTPQMTATEVLERSREKGALLSPTMGRYQSEALGPMIQREFDVLYRQGLLPKIPAVVHEARGEYEIQYDSPLSRAMRAEEASGVMRTAQFAAEVAAQTQDPSVMDFFDWDAIIPTVADINGSPFRFMRTMEQVQQLRQGRSQQAQSEQMIQAAPGVAAVTSAMAKAKQAGLE